MSTFINNTAIHGVPQYIIASSLIISNDATYEGIQLYQYDLTYNMALSNGICGEDNNDNNNIHLLIINKSCHLIGWNQVAIYRSHLESLQLRKVQPSFWYLANAYNPAFDT